MLVPCPAPKEHGYQYCRPKLTWKTKCPGKLVNILQATAVIPKSSAIIYSCCWEILSST
jgi:hypothetical protein